MAQSSDPRPASRKSDTLETFGDAEPSDIHGRATTPVRSLSAQPFLLEDVATIPPTVGETETYVRSPDHFALRAILARMLATLDHPGRQVLLPLLRNRLVVILFLDPTKL